MTQDRKPLSLAEALSDLGPEQASADFTRRVLEELDQPRPPRVAGLSAHRAASFLALAAVGLVLGLWLRPQPAGEESGQAPASNLVRQEYQSLQHEVAALRTRAAQPLPVLYLGGDSRIDLVLDLRRSDLETMRSETKPAAAGSRRVELEGGRPN